MKIRFHWGVAVAVFYTAFALATLGFVGFALTQDVELVSDDYYARSLEHDRQAQAAANADALGDALVIAPRADAGGVRVQWPLVMAPHVRGTATMYRASDAKADRTVPLVAAADGSVSIPTTGLASGRWQLQLQWHVGDREYYAQRDIRLP